jgi:hypothetical protein
MIHLIVALMLDMKKTSKKNLFAQVHSHLKIAEHLFHMKSVSHCMVVVQTNMKKNLLVMSLMSMMIQTNIRHGHYRVQLMNKKNLIVRMTQSLFLMLLVQTV